MLCVRVKSRFARMRRESETVRNSDTWYNRRTVVGKEFGLEAKFHGGEKPTEIIVCERK